MYMCLPWGDFRIWMNEKQLTNKNWRRLGFPWILITIACKRCSHTHTSGEKELVVCHHAPHFLFCTWKIPHLISADIRRGNTKIHDRDGVTAAYMRKRARPQQQSTPNVQVPSGHKAWSREWTKISTVCPHGHQKPVKDFMVLTSLSKRLKPQWGEKPRTN